ncbi:unnamed protein product, partial [Orchesella dallaii]
MWTSLLLIGPLMLIVLWKRSRKSTQSWPSNGSPWKHAVSEAMTANPGNLDGETFHCKFKKS